MSKNKSNDLSQNTEKILVEVSNSKKSFSDRLRDFFGYKIIEVNNLTVKDSKGNYLSQNEIVKKQKERFGWSFIDEKNRVEDLYTQRYTAFLTVFGILLTVAVAEDITLGSRPWVKPVILLFGGLVLLVVAVLIQTISRKLDIIHQLLYMLPAESPYCFIKKYEKDPTGQKSFTNDKSNRGIKIILLILGSVLPLILTFIVFGFAFYSFCNKPTTTQIDTNKTCTIQSETNRINVTQIKTDEVNDTQGETIKAALTQDEPSKANTAQGETNKKKLIIRLQLTY